MDTPCPYSPFPGPHYGGRIPVRGSKISGAQNLSGGPRVLPGPGFAKIAGATFPQPRLPLPSQRSRSILAGAPRGSPIHTRKVSLKPVLAPPAILWKRSVICRRGGYQPPASNGIKCPGSLAVQGFRQAKRGLLRRTAAQKQRHFCRRSEKFPVFSDRLRGLPAKGSPLEINSMDAVLWSKCSPALSGAPRRRGRGAYSSYLPKYSAIRLMRSDWATWKGQRRSQWPQEMQSEACFSNLA